MALADQRYMLFFVPAYDRAGASSGAPLSYLKLGSLKSDNSLTSDKERGDDLLDKAGLSTTSYARLFADDERGNACSSRSTRSAPAYTEGTHRDQAHSAAECVGGTVVDPSTTYYRSDEQGSQTTSQTRTQLSAQLLGDGSTTDPRGGWRDHTDGNRITTVRGDRVDVVVGNYKRVVFGRNDVGPSSWEASGGHIAARTSTDSVQQYAIEQVTETDIDGKTYTKLVERADNADCVFRYAGKQTEHHNGPIRKTTIGVDQESSTKNPEITTRHRMGTVDRDIDADSVTRAVEVQTYVSFEDGHTGGDASLDSDIRSANHDHHRGTYGDRLAHFKEELYIKRRKRFSVCAARFDYQAVGFLDERTGGMFTNDIGGRIHIQWGAYARYQYGTRTRLLFGNHINMWIGTAQIDVGLYGKSSLLLFKYGAVGGSYTCGKWDLSFQQSVNSGVQTKALGLLVKL